MNKKEYKKLFKEKLAEMPRVEFHILIVTILLCCYGAIMICSFLLSNDIF